MEKNQYRKEPLKDNVEEMFIGPFGSSLKKECFVDERNAYCMVYEQKHAIQKTLAGKNRFVDRNKYQELKRFTVKPGDIIVSCRGTIGETFIIPENAPLGIMHPSIMKIRLKPNVYNIEYFNLLLKSRLEAYNKSANGSGVKMAISATELGKDLFPIPPMDEQQKISRIFFMVEHLMLLRKQQLAKMDELVKARFVEMFGDPIANPKQYKCYTVDDIIQFQGGSQPDKKFFEYEKTPDNIRLIQIRDYRTDKFATYIPTTMAKRFCTAEDIMIGRYGPPIFQILQGLEGSFNVALMKATPKRGNREFIRWFLKQDCLLHYLEGLSKRTAGQDGIQIDKLKAYPFPYPPDELQNEFATFVERVDQQKQTVQQSLEKLELMKKALMQEYFG